MNNKIPPKPPGTNWTDEQWEAISRPTGNILVAAGAGSGKTRVLVERIIKKVVDKKNPLEIGKLLVVTFTNAAAAEMRQRIGKALEGAIKNNPRSGHLRRQMLLLNKSNITTMHSFCMEVIQKYYYLRNQDPSSRILDNTEGELLRQEALEDVLEEHYEKEGEDSPFYRLVEVYSNHQGDKTLQEIIQRLYSFSRSHPWPQEWLTEMADSFNVSPGEITETPWFKIILLDCILEIGGVLSLLYSARNLASSPGGPTPYLENIENDTEMIYRVQEGARGSWRDFKAAVEEVNFGRLKSCRGENYDSVLIEKVKNLRNSAKETFKDIKENFFSRPLEERESEVRALAPLVKTLVSLVNSFEKKYKEVKAQKGTLDFSDLEHYALSILTKEGSTSDCLLPSDAALDYRQRFQEVLVDEYQDTNEIQETILKLVSNMEEEKGNLFMVGDVKQSIYRFRLTEPGLFLKKYKDYSFDEEKGKCIDLARNFRSRGEVLAGVNYLFRQLMDEVVGEVNYDDKARLICGASYPPLPGEKENEIPVEVLLISRAKEEDRSCEETAEEIELDTAEEDSEENLEKSSLEGRLIAEKIKELIGGKGNSPSLVYDKKREEYRPINYRDIVILLRSGERWAPPIMDELRNAGIPAYADLSSGYFDALEIEVMLSLLKVIDNPYQDISLAAVLRSPLVGLKGEELAQIRITAPGPYYEAIKSFCLKDKDKEEDKVNSELRSRVKKFLGTLQDWQRSARQGALSELIWQIYRETGYYDFVGGMPGGNQRQANLRAFYDRARQYEATSFRGLFRFLRFVEKLKGSGGDLGTARALGEQEDVVRILTIHKSKGLEFPVVFVAGLSKIFNTQDLKQEFLLHKDLGFGPRFIDTDLKISYPSLPFLAIKKQMQLELLAEEMRILYVALTRAEEKLYLVATVKDIKKEIEKWSNALPEEKDFLLAGYYRAKARSYLDWIGPALLRHPEAEELRKNSEIDLEPLKGAEKSFWKISILAANKITVPEKEKVAEEKAETLAEKNKVMSFNPVIVKNGMIEEVERRLSWSYPYSLSVSSLAKMSVSELKKRRQPLEEEEVSYFKRKGQQLLQRPQFLGEAGLTPTERGTAYHAVMQYLNWENNAMKEEEILKQLDDMVEKEKITFAEKQVIQTSQIATFFKTSLGMRLIKSKEVMRELSFNLALPACEVYTAREIQVLEEGEKVLLQGVIDCIFRENNNLVLLDYKTDNTKGLKEVDLKKRYREQLDIYTRAVEDIWQEKVSEKYLYFFDGEIVLKID